MLGFYSCADKPTVISGSFDQDVDYILLSNAELAICYEYFLDTIFLDNQKSFELSLDIKEDRFFILRIPSRSNPSLKKEIILPVQAGGNYRIAPGEDHKYLISGTNEEGIRKYQSVIHYKTANIDFSLFKSDSLSREEIIEKKKLFVIINVFLYSLFGLVLLS